MGLIQDLLTAQEASADDMQVRLARRLTELITMPSHMISSYDLVMMSSGLLLLVGALSERVAVLEKAQTPERTHGGV